MNENIINAVKVIKAAILESQAQVLRNANCSLLSLYYGIGRFVSANSRKRTWGTGAIAAISELLQKEMPGLRGFGERNIKNMRTFYEFWSPLIDRQGIDVFNIRQPSAAGFDLEAFLSVGFSHHVEIMAKAKTFEACFYYIDAARRCRWNKYELREHLKADDFHHEGRLPNNFAATISAPRQAMAAIRAFRDEYVLDFLNVEDIDASSSEDVDERVLENSIVANIKKFIMAFGRDFTFVKRLKVESGSRRLPNCIQRHQRGGI